MNSALQCLMATSVLTTYFKSGDHQDELNTDNPLGAKGQLALQYAELLNAVRSNTRAITPRKFKATLDAFAPQFRGHRQHDAQEFLSFLLDGIHEDLNRIQKKPYIEDKDCDGTNDEEDAVVAWQNYLKRDKSPIVDIFQGQLRSELCCTICKHRNIRFEPFMYLSLPIPSKAKTVDDCLDAYLEKETLTGTNQWYCSKCKAHVDATKRTALWVAPPILIIHLKRFQLNDFGQVASKNKTIVHFDEYWDLSDCIARSHFDLYAVSYHHGGRTGGGHYTAAVRRKQRWFQCNDAHVSPVDDISSDGAYVLFYQRRSNSIGVRRQSESRPDLWPHANSQRQFYSC